MGGQRQLHLGSFSDISLCTSSMRPFSFSSSAALQPQVETKQTLPPQPSATTSATNTTTSNWRQARDISLHRKSMQKAIAALLQERAPQQSSSQALSLTQVEASLFRSAPSLGAYLDRGTLRKRLATLREQAEARRRVTRHVYQLFLSKHGQDNTNANNNNNNNNNNNKATLWKLSRQCEVSLYRSASCFEHYQEVRTIPQRLKVLLQGTLNQRA